MTAKINEKGGSNFEEVEKNYTTCRIIRVNPKGQQITPSPSDKLAAIRNKSSNSYKHKASFSSLLLRARLRLSLDHEPITCRKQLYLCHGVSLTSLFLERVWREFEISRKSHKSVSKTYRF